MRRRPLWHCEGCGGRGWCVPMIDGVACVKTPAERWRERFWAQRPAALFRAQLTCCLRRIALGTRKGARQHRYRSERFSLPFVHDTLSGYSLSGLSYCSVYALRRLVSFARPCSSKPIDKAALTRSPVVPSR
ncbi:unnamed protein product, partial [Iphiclides podalirius]